MVAAADSILRQLGVEPDRSNPVPVLRQHPRVVTPPHPSPAALPAAGKALAVEEILAAVSPHLQQSEEQMRRLEVAGGR